MAAGSIGNLKLVNPIMESGTLEKIGNVDKITVSTFRSVIKEFGEVLGIREDAIKDIEGINGGKRLVNFFKNNEEISSLVSKEQLTIEEVSKLGNAIQKEAELAIKTLKSLGEGLAKQAEAGAKEIRIPGKKAGIIESALTKSRTLSGTENV